jgi:hypothetical protein
MLLTKAERESDDGRAPLDYAWIRSLERVAALAMRESSCQCRAHDCFSRIGRQRRPAQTSAFVGKGVAGSRPPGRSLSGNAIVARVARLGAGAPLSLGEGESEVDLVVSSTRIGKVRQRRISRPPCSWRIRGLLDRGPRALPSCWRSIFLPTAFAWLPTSDVSSATLAACRQRRRYLARRPTMRVAGNSWLPPSRRLQRCRR